MSVAPSVLVAGAGLAGLTAALHAARAGASVTLIDAAPHAGGRMATVGRTGFIHGGERWDFPIEHGVHGVWHGYSNLRRLLRTIGADREVEPCTTQALVLPTWAAVPGRAAALGFGSREEATHIEVGARLRQSRLPDALALGAITMEPHIAWSLLHVGPGRTLAFLGRLLHALAFDATRDAANYDQWSVADFLEDAPPLVARFLESLSHNAAFAGAERVSLSAFFAALSHYVLDGKVNTAFGLFRRDAGAAVIDPLLAAFAAAGGQFLSATRLDALHVEGGRVVGARLVDAAGPRTMSSAGTVVALDPPAFAALCERSALASAFSKCVIPDGWPSTVVRLFYERSPLPDRADCGVYSGFAADNYFWLHRIATPFVEFHRRTGGSVIECHLYGERARESANLPDAEIVARVTATVANAWPELAAPPLHVHVLRNPPTHVAPAPGQFARAPSTRTSLRGLYLAGDWIRAQHSCMYMERACLTGLNGARALIEDLDLDLARIPAPLAPPAPALSVRLARPLARRIVQRLPFK